jgi:hypothetical protein
MVIDRKALMIETFIQANVYPYRFLQMRSFPGIASTKSTCTNLLLMPSMS